MTFTIILPSMVRWKQSAFHKIAEIALEHVLNIPDTAEHVHFGAGIKSTIPVRHGGHDWYVLLTLTFLLARPAKYPSNMGVNIPPCWQNIYVGGYALRIFNLGFHDFGYCKLANHLQVLTSLCVLGLVVEIISGLGSAGASRTASFRSTGATTWRGTCKELSCLGAELIGGFQADLKKWQGFKSFF